MTTDTTNALRALWSYVQDARVAFSGHPSSGHFRTVGTRIEQIMGALATAQPEAKPEGGAAHWEAIESYRAQVASLRERLEREIEEHGRTLRMLHAATRQAQGGGEGAP